jgi:hypothetical protein
MLCLTNNTDTHDRSTIFDHQLYLIINYIHWNALLSYIHGFVFDKSHFLCASSDLADLALRAPRRQTALTALGVVADHVLDYRVTRQTWISIQKKKRTYSA